MATWRVGRKLGRTLYKDDRCVGIVDTPELAEEIVRKMNADSVRPGHHPPCPAMLDDEAVCTCGQ